MPATKKTKPETDYAMQEANLIIKDAIRSCSWGRLAVEGRLVECRSILCTRMLTDRSGAPADFWRSVFSNIMSTLDAA